MELNKLAKSSTPLPFWLTLAGLLVAFALTLVSWLKICSEQCKEGSSYLMWGYHFEVWGFLLLSGLLAGHLLSRRFLFLRGLIALMLAASLGAELWFIYVQKFLIGHWCPVCLALAATLALAFGSQLSYLSSTLGSAPREKPTEGGVKMQSKPRFWSLPVAALAGFLFAFLGVAKFDPVAAAQDQIREEIAFGSVDGPIALFFFSDWQCPSCRKLEPQIEQLFDKLQDKAKITFVDFPVHQETLNFTPYHLAFMVHNKDKYLRLRKKMSELSQVTGEPTEKQIEQAALSVGAVYKPLNYAEVSHGMRYFNQLSSQFGINSTPTLILVNLETKKGRKLKGGLEINERSVLDAIAALR